MNNNFSFTVQGHQGTCKTTADFPDHVFQKFAATTCEQMTSGRTYYTKIKEVKHRSEACETLDQSTLTCKQGPFPDQPYDESWNWQGEAGGDGNPVTHECMTSA